MSFIILKKNLIVSKILIVMYIQHSYQPIHVFLSKGLKLMIIKLGDFCHFITTFNFSVVLFERSNKITL